ncbi:MAG: dihydroorotase [Spirochaetota bacterium]
MPVSLRAPDDFHVHLRQPPLLGPVVRETARWFDRVLVMPNTVPPVTTAESLVAYRDAILAEVPSSQTLELLMTFKLVPELPAASVAALKAAGAIGGKLYPRGVTTNSADGVDEIDALFPVLEAMEAHDLVLEIHAEAPDAFSLDREAAYLPTIERLAARYPELRIVIEHVSSAAAIRALRSLPDTVAATVTVHHLLLTLDDVVGGELRPHHFCKPIAKRPDDREAIVEAVLSGDPRVFFGSDSAPHPRDAKESDCGCAGIYTAPVAIPLLAEFFERAGLPLTEAGAHAAPGETTATAGSEAAGGEAAGSASLESFVSRYGAEFYRLPLSERRITLVEAPWDVPSRYGDVVPFRAGTRLTYTISGGTDGS